MVEKAFFELLKGLAGGNVFALNAPANSLGPFIVFQRTDSEVWRSINGPSGIIQAYIQVDVYAPKYFQAKDMAEQVSLILDGYRGTVLVGTDSPQQAIKIAGISKQTDVDILDETDNPKLYRVSHSFLATYEGK